jgi:hypothetical protein
MKFSDFTDVISWEGRDECLQVPDGSKGQSFWPWLDAISHSQVDWVLSCTEMIQKCSILPSCNLLNAHFLMNFFSAHSLLFCPH